MRGLGPNLRLHGWMDRGMDGGREVGKEGGWERRERCEKEVLKAKLSRNEVLGEQRRS